MTDQTPPANSDETPKPTPPNGGIGAGGALPVDIQAAILANLAALAANTSMQPRVKKEPNVLGLYHDEGPIGMDHPLFMARMQAGMDAGWLAAEGVPLSEAIRQTRQRMQDLFGDVPLAMIDATVTLVYAQRAPSSE